MLVALVVVGTGLATAIWLPTRNDAADASERARGRQHPQGEHRASHKAQLIFADNFSGDRGNRVDDDKWVVAHGSDRDVSLDGDGHLALIARKPKSGEFTEARLQTRKTFKQTYGLVEARIKVADGNGISSAFRLLGADVDRDGKSADRDRGGSKAAVIDVAQNAGQKSHVIRGAIQGPGYSGDDKISRTLDAEKSFADDFHTYAVDWQPNLIVWSVDGNEFFRVTPADLHGDPRIFDRPFALNLDLSADGDLSETDSPQRMLVDFVHVTAFDEKTPPSDDPTSAPPTSAPPTSAPPTAPTTKPPATTAPTTAPTTVPPTTPPTSTAPVAKPWKPFTIYLAGQHVTFGGVEYQVRATHTSLPGWEPPALPGLFKRL